MSADYLWPILASPFLVLDPRCVFLAGQKDPCAELGRRGKSDLVFGLYCDLLYAPACLSTWQIYHSGFADHVFVGDAWVCLRLFLLPNEQTSCFFMAGYNRRSDACFSSLSVRAKMRMMFFGSKARWLSLQNGLQQNIPSDARLAVHDIGALGILCPKPSG